MTCDRVRDQLTAYLDGDLDADRGTVVRGHLRGCDACRGIAADEAALRDGLRALPPRDPPPALWDAVRARLAAAEVEEARRPAWRRALAKWAPTLPRLATGGLLAAAAVAVLWWRTHRADGEVQLVSPRDGSGGPPIVIKHPTPEIKPSRTHECRLDGSADDVTADLAGDATRLTDCYAKAADDLLAQVDEARTAWTPAQQRAFDAEVAALHDRRARATTDKQRQRAYRAMIGYVRNALTRDEIVLASVAPAGGVQ